MRDHEHSNIAGALGVALVVALVLAGRPAFAHIVDGSATGGFLGGFAHPLFGLDHVVAMIAVGLWGSFLGPPAIWLLPITFPMVMALGGAIATLAILTETEVLLVFIGGVFLFEAVTWIIQIATFKRTGKRVFLMVPIHHHFELKAWSETKIILRFWIVAAVCSAVGFTLYQQSLT